MPSSWRQLVLGSVLAAGAVAQDFRGLTIEQLMEVDVAVVSPRPTQARQSAGAVYVLTREEIRRSGLRTLPEMLRLVPGIQVSRISGSRWAIGARGFAGEYANTLLVMIDGRSVYNHWFSGVLWDENDVLLEDVERIEVIRGPGGARWGANAVSGVIHVITRNARDTQDTVVDTQVGSLETRTAVRHGFQLGERTWGRVHGQWWSAEGQAAASGADTADALERLRGGFRLDGERGEDLWSLRLEGFRGDASSLQATPVLGPPYAVAMERETTFEGGFVQGEWVRRHEGGGQTTLRALYDYTERAEWDWLRARRHRVDLEAEHAFEPTGGHAVTVSGNYRRIEDDSDGSTALSFAHPHRRADLAGVSVFDDIELCADRLRLGLGLKLEYHDVIGLEPQPDLRLTWTPADDLVVWGSTSRAVRVPSRIDDDLQYQFGAGPHGSGLPLVLELHGDRGTEPESLWAYELGTRWRATADLALDLSVYFHDYADRTAGRLGTPAVDPTPTPHIVQPVTFGNGREAEVYGGELAARWQPGEGWNLTGSFSFARVMERLDGPGFVLLDAAAEGATPRHMAHLQIDRDLGQAWQLTGLAFYYDSLPAYDVPGFVRLDLRLVWTPDPSRELAVVGQNLLDDRHPEFGQSIQTVATEVERGVYLEFVQRF